MKWRGLKLILALVSAFMWLDVPWLCLDVRGQSVVFPGAQGFGIETPAGRGGRIIRVTNLNASGPGSLREALLGIGPRVVVFEVGGVIDLRWEDNFFIVEPYLTVAGQTAPSPGVTIIRGTLHIYTNDILIQHLRFRRGIGVVPEGWPEWGDCISIWADANDCNIVIDHCSLTWGTDEILSIMGSIGPQFRTQNITFSNCIIAEGLAENKDSVSCGSLIGNVSNIAVIGNLYANNGNRNPIFSGDTTGVIVNNVIYNPMIDAIELGPYAGPPEYPPSRSSVVGNVLIPGVDTYKPHLVNAHSTAEVYLEDNIVQGFSEPPLKGGVISLAEKPLWPSGLKALPASEVVRYVATHAGARPMDRDEVDKRIIRQMLDGTGRIIRTQEEVGGYPTAKMTRCRLTIPETDIDTWLARLAGDLEEPNSEGFETSNFIAFDWRRYDAENWTVTSGEKNSGEYSARAGSISDNESSALSITLDCISGDISFYCKVSSERDCDRLEFYIDGIRQDKWSGEKDWAEVSFPVTAGRRTFEWTYSKDGSESIDDDTAWIDDIVFPILNDIGLAAHWALGEIEGAVAPDSAAGNDGILNGNPAWRPADGALEFDGADDYVTTPFVLDPADGPFSVFARIKGGAAGQVVLSQVSGANWLMADPAEGNLMTGLSRPGGARVVPPPLLSQVPIADGAWHRIGFTWDGAERVLYVDDVEVARDAQPSLVGAAGQMQIGADKNLAPTAFWSGLTQLPQVT